MANKQETLDLIAFHAAGAGNVRIKKMFGEAALYLDEVVVALICDDRLYLKPTEAGKEVLGEPELGPPYPGAKDHFVVPESAVTDSGNLVELLQVTKANLPSPKPKKRLGKGV